MKIITEFLRKETPISNGNRLLAGFSILGLSALGTYLNLKLLESNLDKLEAEWKVSGLSKKLKESEETIKIMKKNQSLK